MTTASAELLACPFCGQRPRFISIEVGEDASIACLPCDISMHDEDDAGVIAKWNRRSGRSALTRAVQPASKPVGDGGAVRDALATLIKYAVWQVKEGADHHPTLPSAIAQAGAALTPPLQPAADAEVELTARYLNDAAVVLRNGGYMEFAGNNDQAAALLRLLAAERGK